MIFDSDGTKSVRLAALQEYRNAGYEIKYQCPLQNGGVFFYLEKRTHEPRPFPEEPPKPRKDALT